MDVVRIELPGLDELLDLRDGHLAAGRDHRVEVARRLPVDQVPRRVALPRLDDRYVGANSFLEHVLPAVERPRLLVLGERRTGGRARVEAGDSRSAGAQLLGERALRRELQFQLAREHLPLELPVLAHVGGDHLAHLAAREQQAHAEIVDARVVADDREPPDAAVDERLDQILRDAAQPESAGRDRHVVAQQALQRFLRIRVDLLHGSPSDVPAVRDRARAACRDSLLCDSATRSPAPAGVPPASPPHDLHAFRDRS